MKVASKVAVGSMSLLLVFAGAMLHQLLLVRGLAQAQRNLSTAKIRAAKISLEQTRLVEEMYETVRKLYASQDLQYRAKIERLRLEYASGLAELTALELSGDEANALSRLSAAWVAVPPTPRATDKATLLAAPLLELRQQTDEFLATVENAIELQGQSSAAASSEANRIALAVVLVAVALSLLVVRLTVRSIQDSLSRLKAGTRTVATGEFDLELDTSRGDEFSELAADFNVMVQRLGELDTIKKDLLSHVSHELKTPLATLQETQQVLLEEIPGPLNAQQRRLLELNLKSSERLSRLISKLLDLSRLEAGAIAYDFSRRKVARLVADAVEELGPHAHERRIRIETEWEEDLELDCDGDRIIQVISNLVENAIKFSPEGGVVRLDARAVTSPPESLPADLLRPALDGRAVLITVSDAGPGVPDEEKRKIFEKFHQASRRRSGLVGGAGLGLAICRSIAEAHGGVLWVADNPPRGSTFSVLLPRHESVPA